MSDYSQLTVTRGADSSPVLHITRDGKPLDLTGMAVTWQAASNHGDDAPVLGPYTATVAADPTTGVATVAIPAADSADLDLAGYLWDAQVTDGGKVVKVARGVIHVLEGITA